MNKAQRAERARAILGDVVFKDALNRIRERHLSTFENSAPDKQSEREAAYQALTAVKALKVELESEIEDYEIEKGRHRDND